MLIVISAMALLLALIAPAFTTGSPRRSAVITLKTALESARSVAIRDKTEVYVAFTDDGPQDPSDRYSHFAVFARVKENRSGTETGKTYDQYFSHQLAGLGDIGPDGLPRIDFRQLVEWTQLPDGIVFGLAGPPHNHVEGLSFTALEANVDSTVVYEREFPVPGRFVGGGGAGSTMILPFLAFNSEGRLSHPQFFEPERHYLALVEGFIQDNGNHLLTGSQQKEGASAGAETARSEVIGVNLYSGRVRIISQGR